MSNRNSMQSVLHVNVNRSLNSNLHQSFVTQICLTRLLNKRTPNTETLLLKSQKMSFDLCLLGTQCKHTIILFATRERSSSPTPTHTNCIYFCVASSRAGSGAGQFCGDANRDAKCRLARRALCRTCIDKSSEETAKGCLSRVLNLLVIKASLKFPYYKKIFIQAVG